MIFNLNRRADVYATPSEVAQISPRALPPTTSNHQPYHTESLLLVYSCLKILWGARYGGNTLHIELPPLMTANRAPFEVTLTRDLVRIKYLQPLLYPLDILYCIPAVTILFVCP